MELDGLGDRDEQALLLGRQVIKMICDVAVMPAGDAAYATHRMRFRDDSMMTLFVIRDQELVDIMNRAVEAKCDVRDVQAPSNMPLPKQ